jgi:hypothetical protein
VTELQDIDCVSDIAFQLPMHVIADIVGIPEDDRPNGVPSRRRSLPHMQRLLGHLEDSLKELERAVGVCRPRQAGQV